jgi:basic amino acid/polyamine antiporter, APA family
MAFFNIGNYTPLLSQHHPEYGAMGIVVGGTLVFYAYLGFDIIPAVAEEAKNPKKDVPRAIIHQVLYVMVIYIVVAFFVNGVGRMENFQGETAIAMAFEAIGHPWVAGVIYVCAFLGITASAFINMMGQSRLLYSLAKDGLFFERFKELDPVRRVPVRGAWISCLAVVLFSIFLDVEELTFILSIENLLTYSIVNAGLLALRFREDPEVRHPNEWWAWVYLGIAFVFSISWGYQWPWYIVAILGICVIVMIVKLHMIP